MTESFPASVDSTEKCPTKRGPWMWLLLVMLFIASSLMARGMRLSARSSPGLRSALHLCANKPNFEKPPEPVRGKGGVLPEGQKRAMGSRGKEADALKKYPKAKDIHVPLDKVDFAFARSSGPGGQNVNKLNTKAELRFHIDSASWIPSDVRERLKEYQSNKINNNGELLVTSQEFRTQSKNKDDCVEKLQVMLEEAYVEPKDRKMWVGIGKKTKIERRDGKRHRANIKANRGKVNKNDY